MSEQTGACDLRTQLQKLRQANVSRLPHFKNNEGETAHTSMDGSDWSPLEWGGAAAGEVGELCNLLKKLKRRENVPIEQIEDEIADVIIYLDILSFQLRGDLWKAVVRKFNKTSRKVGSPIMLGTDDHIYD